MALLKVLAMMTALAATAAAMGGMMMCNPENDIKMIMMGCFGSVGISEEELMKFRPNEEGMMMVTKQDLQQMCRMKDQHIQAHMCMKDYIMRCPGVPMQVAKHVDSGTRMIEMTCGDPKLDLGCIAALMRNFRELGVCVNEMKEGWMEEMSMEKEMCMTGRAYMACSVQLLSACDAYTAAQFEAASSMMIPPGCEEK